ADTLLATLDGRPSDLERNVSSSRMPVISENFFKALGWNGIGKMPREAQKRLRQLVRMAHRQGKKIRFWAAPDTPAMWQLLLKHKVDLINTDRISEFADFYQTY
ncbi:MAG: histidinol-phosphatase, partial [Bacteroidota bacterium]